MDPMRYQLVCLDAGFTLLAPRRTLTDALRGALGAHGYTVGDQDLHRAWEVADHWFWEGYQRPDNDTWTDDGRIDAHWREYHGVMLRELGIDDAKGRLIELILEGQYAPDSWELYADVLPTLTEMHAAGLRLGVVSDWGSNLVPIITGLGLGELLDFVLASGSEGLAKPDPAFFRLAAERAGVATADTLMVGDSYRADVEGAQAAGMTGILLRRPEWRDRREAVPAGAVLISSLAELSGIVLGVR